MSLKKVLNKSEVENKSVLLNILTHNDQEEQRAAHCLSEDTHAPTRSRKQQRRKQLQLIHLINKMT